MEFQKARLRVAIISSQAHSIVNFRGPLLREMARRGVVIYALAPDYDDSSRVGVQTLGAVPVDYSLSRTGMNPLRDFVDLIRLMFRLRSLKPNATFAYFIKPVIYGTLAARVAGVARRFAMIEGAGYVFTENEKKTIRQRLLRSFVTRLYKVSLSQTHHVFMLNRDDKKLFVDEGMVCGKKVQLLSGIGLDLEHYQVAPLVSRPICFILIARLIREKGIYEYVRAARAIKKTYPETRFILLGGIDLNPGSITESEVKSWVEEGIIEWPGQVADVRAWIAQASVFVLPSYYREGLPRSTQEAMSMGRPVITTDMPGCRETVDEGVNGFMVPPRNAEALSEAMLKFINRPEIIAPMGVESRKMAEIKFDVHKTNDAILKALGI